MRGLFYLLKPLAPGDHNVRVRLDFRKADPIIATYQFTVVSR